MSGTRIYSDYVCRSVNGWEKKRNCSEKAEVKGQRQINRLNVKYVSRAVEGTEVIVKFSSRRYQATIIDILESQSP